MWARGGRWVWDCVEGDKWVYPITPAPHVPTRVGTSCRLGMHSILTWLYTSLFLIYILLKCNILI
jgi:hypothetical protein